MINMLRRVRKIQLKLLIKLHLLLGKEIIHFIHIGKAGGTSVKSAFKRKITFHGRFIIIMQGHVFKLDNTKDGEKVFFVVRDPIARYISGFYSRYRMGRPRNNNPWREDEKIAFTNFETPGILAEALSSRNSDIRQKANSAMNNIGHVNTRYWDWLKDKEYLQSRVEDIVFVLCQENLAADFSKFKSLLGLEAVSDLPSDDIATHKTPEEFDKKLSLVAIENLQEWYKEDYECLFLLSQSEKLSYNYI